MIRPRFTLGGTLSIVNCFFWVCIAAGARELPEWAFMALMPLMVFLALPIAIPFLMPGGFFGSSAQGVVLDAVLVGINSLLWGHGLAWILRTVGRRFGWIPRAQDDPLRSNRRES